jgi:hypothetical protein
VYVEVPTVAVLIVAGFHVPVIAGIFVELSGRTGGAEFRQSGPIWVNVGVMDVAITISIVAVEAH